MTKTVCMQPNDRNPKVLLLCPGKQLRSIELAANMVLGRATETNPVDIALEERYVSRKHGLFARDSYGCYYVDTGSVNGTSYNGSALDANRKQYLQNGDVLHIYSGNYAVDQQCITLVFVTDYPTSWETAQIALTPETAEVDIGRDSGQSVQMKEETVSSRHASFFLARDGWAIMDHSSTNGVYLNNQRITGAKYLRYGDCVRVTNLLFFFLGDRLLYQRSLEVSPAPGQMAKPAGDVLEIHIAERSVWHRAKKLMLLQNINMRILPGEMVLILGGSGAGKTTFMNAVMGYEKAQGRILHGTTDIYEDFEEVKYKIGFVPQQDLLRGSDSVYDTLENAAQMKLPFLNKAQREERIQRVLQVLGLSRETQSLVSKLSGGQRKRLSVAVEYIADPSLFFLDEPDSGLDGIMARALMENLRGIADEGKIVMVISHGPDRAADLFDKVIVLAKSAVDNCGHLAFFGTVKDACRFFETDTLEGVVRRINRPDEGGDGLSDHYIRKYDALMNGR